MHHPFPNFADWRRFLTKMGMLGGVLALGSGIIFFFAFNWDQLGRLAQLGLAATALLLSGVCTARMSPHTTAWRTGCLLVSICTGALLALIGQKYQTGADAWQLFAAWAALMLPIALIARSSSVWLLWIMLIDVTLARKLYVDSWVQTFGHESWFYSWGKPSPAALVIAAANILIWSIFQYQSRWLLTQARPWLPRLLVFSVLATLAKVAIDVRQDWQTLLFFIVAAFFAWHALRRQPDTLNLTSVYATSIAVAVTLANTLLGALPWHGRLLITAAGALIASAFALRHVYRLWHGHASLSHPRIHRPTETQTQSDNLNIQRSQSLAPPWWIVGLQAFAAWLCALMFAVALLAPSEHLAKFPGAVLSFGVIALGLWLMRRTDSIAFFREQFGFALSITGQVWLVFALSSLFRIWDDEILLIAASIPFILSWIPTTFMHRSVCLFACILFTGLWACVAGLDAAWLLPILFGLCLLSWLQQPLSQAEHSHPASWQGFHANPWMRAFQHASTCSALLGAVVIQWATSPDQHWMFGSSHTAPFHTFLWSMSIAIIWLLTVGVLYYKTGKPHHWIWLLACLASGLAWIMPAMLLAIAITLLLFQIGQRIWLGAALLTVIVLLLGYYYTLQWTLLQKSVGLCIVGSLMLSSVFLSQYQHKRAA